MFRKYLLVISLLGLSFAHAEGFDELNPRSPDIEDVLERMDEDYELTTGSSPWLPFEPSERSPCYRDGCPAWARINLKEQLFYLYENGALTQTWLTSTGRPGYGTPPMDRHPTGRVYDAYTSTIYPGGDYEGLGNMPYAAFILGGYAIHGTPEGNWSRLGTADSGGCIRLLPETGKIFNRLVRTHGRRGVWVTVERGT